MSASSSEYSDGASLVQGPTRAKKNDYFESGWLRYALAYSGDTLRRI